MCATCRGKRRCDCDARDAQHLDQPLRLGLAAHLSDQRPVPGAVNGAGRGALKMAPPARGRARTRAPTLGAKIGAQCSSPPLSRGLRPVHLSLAVRQSILSHGFYRFRIPIVVYFRISEYSDRQLYAQRPLWSYNQTVQKYL